MADTDKILRETINKIVIENNWKSPTIDIKAITSGGANYTSALYLVNILLPDKNEIKLFAKVALVGEKMREVMSANRLFYLEAFYYNNLSKTYDKLQLNHGLGQEEKFIYPKFYGCNTSKYEETVVLDNLVAKGYGSYSRFKSVDWDHAAAAVEALARFHALSFAFQKENPEEFDAVCKDIKYIHHTPDEATKEVWEKMVKKSLNEVKEEYREQVWKCLEAGIDKLFIKFRYPLGSTVITHGDYRASNLLFKREGDKVHAIPVDYQTIHSGSPPADLMYFEVLGTDSAFRAKYHDRLMDHYYSELTAALQRLDVDIVEVYPRELFNKELEETLPYALVLGICLLPIVLVEPENAPRIDGDVEIDSFLITNSDQYPERFNGIIADCIRWGAI